MPTRRKISGIKSMRVSLEEGKNKKAANPHYTQKPGMRGSRRITIQKS